MIITLVLGRIAVQIKTGQAHPVYDWDVGLEFAPVATSSHTE